MVFNTQKNVTTLVEIFGNIFDTKSIPNKKQVLTLNKQNNNSVNLWLL